MSAKRSVDSNAESNRKTRTSKISKAGGKQAARKRNDQPNKTNKVTVGYVREISGEVNVAGGNIYKGFTAEQVNFLIDQIKTDYQVKNFDGTCPYKGLDAFDEEDAELFFGREKLVDDLVERVKESRTVFVTGPSGSGKSSLVRAGLIPDLKKGSIKVSHDWQYLIMKPGREPIKALAVAVAGMVHSTDAQDDVIKKALTDETIFTRWCDIALQDGHNKRVVLFVDQFEEVFTQINAEEDRVAFFNLLTHAATVENGRVIILFSMRSDFVSNCAIYPKLNELLNQQFIQIGAMQPDELVSAIAQPALRVGLQIDPKLIAQIINETEGEPGSLPLMQFALKDLFDSQTTQNKLVDLNLRDYLQRGGIHKALERHADQTFGGFNTAEQELARSVFTGLIEIGRGTQDTRRTANFDELIPANAKDVNIKAIVDKLADARLIITDEVGGRDTVTISHEKLIDAWPWLKKLVNENRDVIALQNEIAVDAAEWAENHRDSSYLYSGARLVTAREKMIEQKLVLGGLAQGFIEEGMAKQEAERKGKEILRKRITIGLVSGIAIALALAAYGFVQARLATNKATEALARQLASQAQLINIDRSSNQMTGTLLAIQSMQLFPNADAAHYLLNNNFSGLLISRMTHDNGVSSIAISPDGKYVVSGSHDGTARVWEAASGKEVARMTHDDVVTSVAFSPDGKYIVSGSWGNTARVWETLTGKEVARMTHRGSANSVAFSPNGKYVVSGGWDYTARVWEAHTGKEVARMIHGDSVNAVVFSPDGKYVVSGSHDGTARVWEALTGVEVARMTHDDIVWTVAFSPDGKYVASGGCDIYNNYKCDKGTAHVWETLTGKEVARMTHSGSVDSVAFSPDSKYVVSGSWDNTARIWETLTGKEVTRMTHDDIVWTVAFSPDGKYVVSGSIDGTARVWEALTGKEVARMTHDSSVDSVAFSPVGKYVISGSSDNTSRVWEVATGKEVARMTHDDPVGTVAFSPNGKYVVSGSRDKTARVWDVAGGKEVARMTHNDPVGPLAFSPDGKYVVSGSIDGTARVWDVASGKEVARMTHDNTVTSVAFSPNGKYVISGSDDNTVRVWEALTGKEVARMNHDDAVTRVAFSPNSKYVVSGSDDKTARVWEALTGKEVTHMTHDDKVWTVAFSPDGKYVVSGSYEGTVRVWEALTGVEVARMTHDDPVTQVAFSPDGKYVVSGSIDGTARVWEALTGKEVARMTHDSYVSSVAFSPDGKYVVSGSSDNTARVWEVATGKEVARMTHDDPVRTVAFSPDDKFVVSGSSDGTARVWAWQPQDLIANACAFMPRNLTREEWQQYIGDALPYQAVCENLPIEPEVQ